MNVQEKIDAKNKAQPVIEVARAIRRLRENADFKLVIEEAYLKADALNFLQLSVDPRASESIQADVIEKAKAAARFADWLDYREAMGDRAEAEVAAIDRGELDDEFEEVI